MAEKEATEISHIQQSYLVTFIELWMEGGVRCGTKHDQPSEHQVYTKNYIFFLFTSIQTLPKCLIVSSWNTPITFQEGNPPPPSHLGWKYTMKMLSLSSRGASMIDFQFNVNTMDVILHSNLNGSQRLSVLLYPEGMW